MNRRPWAWALGALLVAGTATLAGAEDDRARHKGGGGSSGGHSAAAGERHHSGGSGRSDGEVRSGGDRGASIGSQRESSGGSRGRSSRDSDDPPARRVTGAESRHPIAGTGHGWRVGRSGSYWSAPYFYSRYPSRSYYWYRPNYWGFYGVPYYDFYSSSWDYPYGGGYSGGYSDRYRYRETGSIRTLVDPERTKVLVDGYYAGTVDDFDGMFQRLYVAPGRHDVTFKLEGYRTHRVRVYVTEDHTVKIRHNMEKGSGEDTLEDLTEGREDPPYRMSDEGRAGRPSQDPRDDREARPYDERRDARDAGTLRLEVRPDDASIYVDGEFYGSARRAGSIVLPPGRHRVEVVRPGFRTVEREVEIQPGRTETVSIDLSRS